MTIDKRVLEDPLRAFDYMTRRIYSDAHPTSPEFIKRMRKVIEETPDRDMKYIVLSGYMMLLEKDTYVKADLGRMKIVCEIEEYMKNKIFPFLPKRNIPRST